MCWRCMSAQELGPNVYRPWSIDVIGTWGPRRKLSKQRKFHLSGQDQRDRRSGGEVESDYIVVVRYAI